MATIDGTSGNDTLNGTSGDDTINGLAGDDTIDGLAGNDTINGDDPADVAGDDVIQGGDGNDVIDGGGGTNLLDGGAGDDLILGSYGRDTIIGGQGNDTLQGGEGDDIYIIANAADHVAAEIQDVSPYISTLDQIYFTATTPSTLTLFAGDTGIEWVNISDVNGDLRGTVALNVDASAVLGSLLIQGNNGPNELRGSAGGSYLDGHGGNDTLIGGVGDDTLDGGAGADQMIGGAGNDLYVIQGAGDIVIESAGEGTDIAFVDRSYVLPENVEALHFAVDGNFNGTGNASDNEIGDTQGNNVLRGLGGNDTLLSTSGNDILEGGDGDDFLRGGIGINEASYASAAAGVTVNLGFHHYQDTQGAGSDYLFQIQNITGSAFADVLKGDGASNVLAGNSGDDLLLGRGGDDILTGGAGYDRMHGEAGDDTYYVNDSTDYAYEKADEGHDNVIASVDARLRSNVEDLVLTAAAYIGKGNDIDNSIVGTASSNKLYGFGGADSLNGGSGDDYLSGGDGEDLLTGGAGRDIMSGGAGNDTFAFADGDFGGLTRATADRITDFATGDTLDLSAVDASTQVTGDQAFTFVGASSFTHTAGELRYEMISGSTYISGDTNGDGIADFIIKLDGLHTLQTSDLVL